MNIRTHSSFAVLITLLLGALLSASPAWAGKHERDHRRDIVIPIPFPIPIPTPVPVPQPVQPQYQHFVFNQPGYDVCDAGGTFLAVTIESNVITHSVTTRSGERFVLHFMVVAIPGRDVEWYEYSPSPQYPLRPISHDELDMRLRIAGPNYYNGLHGYQHDCRQVSAATP